MKFQILSMAILTALLAGCGSSGSSNPSDEGTTNQPSNDGTDNSGTDNSGTDNSGTDNSGTDNSGTDNSGTDNSGTDNSDTDNETTDDPSTGNTGFLSIQGNVQLFGVLDVDDDFVSETSDVSGGFIRLDTAVNADRLREELEEEINQQCEVTVTSFLGNNDDTDLDIGFPFQTVSAGETISLSSAAGTYGELQRTTQFGFTGYSSTVDLVHPAPSPLVIDIPGDVFPAFSNVSVVAPQPISGFNIDPFGGFNAETEFRWDASTTADSIISLNFSEFNVDALEFISVECEATDDGSFSLPAETVAEINDNLGVGWTATGISISREVVIVQQQGDAVLVINRITD